MEIEIVLVSLRYFDEVNRQPNTTQSRDWNNSDGDQPHTDQRLSCTWSSSWTTIPLSFIGDTVTSSTQSEKVAVNSINNWHSSKIMCARLILGLEKGEKVVFGIGMWTPWHGGEKTVAMGQTENDQAEDKLDDVFKTGSGACVHRIVALRNS